MTRGYEFLHVKCANCQDELIRIAELETDDRVFCPTCMAWGEYERVVKEGAGLLRGIPVDEQTRDLIDRLARTRREQGP